MKKIINILFLVILCATITEAAQMRHFNIDAEVPISEDQIVEYFSEWFSLPDNSSFSQAKVLTDNQGNKHYRYDQYIGGVLVEGGQILVHTSNGLVQNANGIVLESDIAKSPISNRRPAKASKNHLNEDIVIIPTNNETSFRYAYKQISEVLGSYVYIDTESGDTLDIIPFVYDAQTTLTTNTIYYGRQKMTVNANGQWRYFSVQDPKIETILATDQDFSNASGSFVNNQIQLCNTYYENAADSFNSYIASITFNIKSTSWCSGVDEGVGNNVYPDLYIKIFNNSGTLVYKSPVIDNWKYTSITFNPMFHLDGGKYAIKLYDEDVISDDEGGGFTISTTTKGIGTLSTSNFDVTINITGNPIRDAHWGMEKTLAFYKNVFNLNSYDGNGAPIYQFVNPIDTSALPNNAYARQDYPYCIVYGLGDGIINSPLVSLDIVAHEFTHMVTFHSTLSGLEYKGESGALNEGFSDIFAILIEGYTLGSYDWTIGEKITLQSPYIMRSLKDPKTGQYAQPTTYGKGTWLDPKDTSKGNDLGGVHINNSILGHWFYLLCNGGSGVNDNQHSYNVKGLGISTATNIAYNTWMYRLAGKSTFADARESFIAEVISKYGKDSQEHQSVVNAWYAVGVGNKYTAQQSPVSIKAKMPSNWGSTISAWVWEDGSEGKWATLTKEGEWYSYTSAVNPLNIVFVNGSTWNGDNNQSVDIRLEESACIQLNSNTGKRTYTVIDCPVESERYVILAQRSTSSNWFYMTSDLGTASNKRYQAVDAGTNVLANVNTSNLDSKYYWQIEEKTKGDKLRTAAGYSTWTSGNTAILDNTGKDLTIAKQSDGTYSFSFEDGTNTRYLSLNKTVGNNYFAYYNGTNQIYKLTLLKEGESGIPTSIEIIPTNSQEPHATKVLRNGQIYILRGDHTYTLTGQEVK